MGESSPHYSLERPGSRGDPERHSPEHIFLPVVNERSSIYVVASDRDLPKGVLDVEDGNEGGPSNCINTTLNIWHWPRAANEMFVDGVPVIDAESWASVLLDYDADGGAPRTCPLFNNAVSLHLSNAFVDNFLCAWIGSVRLFVDGGGVGLEGDFSRSDRAGP